MDDIDVDEMRAKFNEAVAALLSNKRTDNKAFLSEEEYQTRIEEVKRAKIVLKTSGLKKSMKDYRRVRKYTISKINGKERLVKPVAGSERVLHYVANEELFDIIHKLHTSIKHAGRNRMVFELKKTYCNITKEAIMVYLRICEFCQKKVRMPRRTRPESPSEMNCRGHIHLIDMEARCYEDFRYILLHQDAITKFVHLKALKTKHVHDLTFCLLDIYTTFGAPAVLDFGTGVEQGDVVVAEIASVWPEVKIYCGKLGLKSSERVRKETEDMVCAWMNENKSRDWPLGLKFMQFRRNRIMHEELAKSPFEAVFGFQAKVDPPPPPPPPVPIKVEIQRNEVVVAAAQQPPAQAYYNPFEVVSDYSDFSEEEGGIPFFEMTESDE